MRSETLAALVVFLKKEFSVAPLIFLPMRKAFRGPSGAFRWRRTARPPPPGAAHAKAIFHGLSGRSVPDFARVDAHRQIFGQIGLGFLKIR